MKTTDVSVPSFFWMGQTHTKTGFQRGDEWFHWDLFIPSVLSFRRTIISVIFISQIHTPAHP